MDTSRISFGETVAAVSGAGLFLFMFVDWFGYDLGEGVFEPQDAGLSAWQWMSFLDILLFLCAAVAIGVAVARATGSMPVNLPASPGQILAAAGALALVIVLFRLLLPGDGPLPGGDLVDATRKVGAFLGLIASAGMAYGGYTAMNERPVGAAPGAGTSPPPPPPSRSTPPSGPPPSEPPSPSEPPP